MDKKILTVIATSLGASLCCITPVLAVLAGASSFATTFSWLDPFRPYFVTLTIIILIYIWWGKLKPQKEIECACEDNEKVGFLKTKTFLSIITIFAVLSISFPYYGNFFIEEESKKEIVIVEKSDIVSYSIKIDNMTCPACEATVSNAIHTQEGIIKSDISYKTGVANIKFDKSKTSIENLRNSIDKTGFTTVEHKEIKKGE